MPDFQSSTNLDRRVQADRAVRPESTDEMDVPSNAPIAVLGIGNLLLADDGIGPLAAQALLRSGPCPGVDILDVGTPGLELTTYLGSARRLILIDAVQASTPPGTVRCYGRAEVMAMSTHPRMSPHDVAVADAIMTTELITGRTLDVVLVGVTVKDTTLGGPVSPEVQAALPRILETVHRLLAPGIGSSPVEPGVTELGREP